MHIVGADLDLHGFALGADDRAVNGLIIIFFGRGDIVVEFAGDVLPETVDDTQGGITVTHMLNQDAYGPDIINLMIVSILPLHL